VLKGILVTVIVSDDHKQRAVLYFVCSGCSLEVCDVIRLHTKGVHMGDEI
jgi:hypothetical protein